MKNIIRPLLLIFLLSFLASWMPKSCYATPYCVATNECNSANGLQPVSTTSCNPSCSSGFTCCDNAQSSGGTSTGGSGSSGGSGSTSSGGSTGSTGSGGSGGATCSGVNIACLNTGGTYSGNGCYGQAGPTNSCSNGFYCCYTSPQQSSGGSGGTSGSGGSTGGSSGGTTGGSGGTVPGPSVPPVGFTGDYSDQICQSAPDNGSCFSNTTSCPSGTTQVSTCTYNRPCCQNNSSGGFTSAQCTTGGGTCGNTLSSTSCVGSINGSLVTGTSLGVCSDAGNSLCCAYGTGGSTSPSPSPCGGNGNYCTLTHLVNGNDTCPNGVSPITQSGSVTMCNISTGGSTVSGICCPPLTQPTSTPPMSTITPTAPPPYPPGLTSCGACPAGDSPGGAVGTSNQCSTSVDTSANYACLTSNGSSFQGVCCLPSSGNTCSSPNSCVNNTGGSISSMCPNGLSSTQTCGNSSQVCCNGSPTNAGGSNTCANPNYCVNNNGSSVSSLCPNGLSSNQTCGNSSQLCCNGATNNGSSTCPTSADKIAGTCNTNSALSGYTQNCTVNGSPYCYKPNLNPCGAGASCEVPNKISNLQAPNGTSYVCPNNKTSTGATCTLNNGTTGLCCK